MDPLVVGLVLVVAFLVISQAAAATVSGGRERPPEDDAASSRAAPEALPSARSAPEAPSPPPRRRWIRVRDHVTGEGAMEARSTAVRLTPAVGIILLLWAVLPENHSAIRSVHEANRPAADEANDGGLIDLLSEEPSRTRPTPTFAAETRTEPVAAIMVPTAEPTDDPAEIAESTDDPAESSGTADPAHDEMANAADDATLGADAVRPEPSSHALGDIQPPIPSQRSGVSAAPPRQALSTPTPRSVMVAGATALPRSPGATPMAVARLAPSTPRPAAIRSLALATPTRTPALRSTTTAARASVTPAAAPLRLAEPAVPTEPGVSGGTGKP